ncbi:polysaccharide pyruvyl transferase family protein [Rothia sp. ZJ1223]|uniref:polysaccharide pyruvyl transferase family protein n=1 Tax=Rothia sp. ZJ1223 TaxID=2811098 RepID=UPI001957B1E7|nr:polysaccharide pyruvyl transferase family protein [Rothia sp. ZJ1223]MBM7051415.1 polysaccharide pyruvyl transferase family protein [Rothia sp. ZJ1223]
MRVLILWANEKHPNLGVAALGQGLESLAKRTYGEDTDVRFHGTGAADLAYNDGPVNISRVKLLIKETLNPKSEFSQWIKKFDVVIDARGGDSFTDIYGLKRQIKTSAISWVTPLLGIPTVLGPQTIGPFTSLPSKLAGILTLKMARQVYARDSISYSFAQKLFRKDVRQATDVVFALPYEKLPKKYDVLLNVSGLLWDENPHVDHLKYRRMIHETIQGLLDQGRSVTLLPHVLADKPELRNDNDLYPLAEVRESFPQLEIVVPEDLMDARACIGSANLVIAARMHACLNALSMGTPAIAMAYSRKFAPLLDQIGWKHTVDLREKSSSAQDILSKSQYKNLADEALRVRVQADERIAQVVEGLKSLVQ